MILTNALSELGQQINLHDLQLNEAGLCRVVFDDSIPVDFESIDEGRTLNLSSVVAPFRPNSQDESFFELLLSGNLLGVATGGAHFSISQEDSEVLFERSIDIESSDFSSFTKDVESFVNHLEAWRDRLSS